MSIEEYETQLAEIETMLAAAPEDPSLLSLKADLLELIATTLGATEATTVTAPTAASTEDPSSSTAADADVAPATETTEEEPAISAWNTVAQPTPAVAANLGGVSDKALESATAIATTEAAVDSTDNNQVAQKTAKKKKKALGDTFVVPANLEIKPTDSKFEAKRKKTAQKRLRKEFEAQHQERIATKKQQSWQAFAKKKKKGSSSSIFQTDESGKVGVVGQRHLTKFEGPTKHK